MKFIAVRLPDQVQLETAGADYAISGTGRGR